MKVFAAALQRSVATNHGSKRRRDDSDDRPFAASSAWTVTAAAFSQQSSPRKSGGGETTSGFYAVSAASASVTSTPNRYEPIRFPAPAEGNRRSFPDLRCHQSSFTIYDEERQLHHYREQQQLQEQQLHQERKRNHSQGYHSNPESPHLGNSRGHFQRSRSSSGRFRSLKGFIGGGGAAAEEDRGQSRGRQQHRPESADGLVWPTSIVPGGASSAPAEPIYSEPLPPITSQIREAEKTKLRYFPDPSDPVQISNHIYEYLVNRRNDLEEAARQQKLQYMMLHRQQAHQTQLQYQRPFLQHQAAAHARHHPEDPRPFRLRQHPPVVPAKHPMAAVMNGNAAGNSRIRRSSMGSSQASSPTSAASLASSSSASAQSSGKQPITGVERISSADEGGIIHNRRSVDRIAIRVRSLLAIARYPAPTSD
jgi:hypothetical protein